MAKIISIGNICIDRILGSIPKLPRWGTEVFFDRYEERLGGQGANFAISCAKLGLETYLVGNVGDDSAGEKILSQLSRVENLNCSFVRKEKCIPTGFTMSLLRTDGERIFLSSLGHQEYFTLDDYRTELPQLINANDMVHVSGFFMLPKIRLELLDFAAECKRKAAKMSFDPGWDPNGFDHSTRTVMGSLLHHFDFFEPDLVELLALSGSDSIIKAAAKIARNYSGLILLKEGKKGSRAFQGTRNLASAKATPAIVEDTTGAGDSFDAGFLCGFLKGYTIEECLKLGNAASSAVISSKKRQPPRLQDLYASLSLKDQK